MSHYILQRVLRAALLHLSRPYIRAATSALDGQWRQREAELVFENRELRREVERLAGEARPEPLVASFELAEVERLADCPACGAGAGEHCLVTTGGRKGKPSRHVHPARIQAAREARKGEIGGEVAGEVEAGGESPVEKPQEAPPDAPGCVTGQKE